MTSPRSAIVRPGFTRSSGPKSVTRSSLSTARIASIARRPTSRTPPRTSTSALLKAAEAPIARRGKHPRSFAILTIFAAALAAVPGHAATDPGEEALNAFVRARLAEEAGEPAAALLELKTVASLAPDLPGVRGRILEQAIQAGDFASARSAAT